MKEMKIGHSAFTLSISKMVTMLLSIVTSMILSRFLSLDDYGTYSELQTITSLIVSIVALGLPNCLNYYLPTLESSDKKQFLGFYYAAITLLSLLMAAAMLVFQRRIALYYKNPELALYSFFLTIIPWTKIVISSRSNMLVVESKIRKELVYCVANAVCLLALAIAVTVTNGSFKWYLVVYVLIEVFFSICVYGEAFYLQPKGLRCRFQPAFIKEILVFSIPLGLSTAISTISLDLDKLVIGFFMDEAAVAVYANAGKELPFGIISTSFTAVVLPNAVKYVKTGETQRAIDTWKNACELCFIILAFCSAACIVFAPQIITLLYSERYLSGVGVFRVYSLVLLLRMTYWGMILNAFGKSRQIFNNSLVCLAINIVSSVTLYLWFGFLGPAIATLISIFIMAVIQVRHSSKLTQTRIEDILAWKSMLKVAAVCVASALAVRLFTFLLRIGTDTKGIVLAILIGICWADCYFAIEWKNIKRLWNKMNH